MKSKKARPGVLVVGSANMDLVVSCERFPRPGETILAEEFGMYPGGKGANQAVACARLGGEVFFLAKMGRDVFCEKLRANLEQEGVHLDYVLTDDEAPTGIALITLNAEGENEIIVVSGSNMQLRPDEVDAQRELFGRVAAVLVQLEVPLDTVARAAELGRARGAIVILNPAPAQQLPAEVLANTDYLTPNETELELLSGLPVRDENTAARAAERLLGQGVGHVIVTLGAQGALSVGREGRRLFPAQPVEVVDTTGAGDAFSGALAFALASAWPLPKAIGYANRVAGYAVTTMGAQAAMPAAAELHTFAPAPGNSVITGDGGMAES